MNCFAGMFARVTSLVSTTPPYTLLPNLDLECIVELNISFRVVPFGNRETEISTLEGDEYVPERVDWPPGGLFSDGPDWPPEGLFCSDCPEGELEDFGASITPLKNPMGGKGSIVHSGGY